MSGDNLQSTTAGHVNEKECLATSLEERTHDVLVLASEDFSLVSNFMLNGKPKTGRVAKPSNLAVK